MSKRTSDNDADIRSTPTSKMVLLLLGTFADTTWRMFVPTLGGFGIGFWADETWDTEPLWMLTGVILGALVAFWLIYVQIKGIKK